MSPPPPGRGGPGVEEEGGGRRAGVPRGAGAGARAAGGCGLKPTQNSPLFLALSLRDRFSGQGSAGERTPVLEAVRVSPRR